MEMVMTLIAAGFGAIGALIVQRVTHGWSQRDRVLGLRQQWVASVLDALDVAWTARPFDLDDLRVFSPVDVTHELRFIDPSAKRVADWLGLRLITISEELKRADQEEEGFSVYLFFDARMRLVEPLLVGWAAGKRRYGPRAVERWYWAALEDSGLTESQSTKEIKRHRRAFLRANRVRP